MMIEFIYMSVGYIFQKGGNFMSRRYLAEFDAGAHSKYLMYAHLVIVTKYRDKILNEKINLRVIGIFNVMGKKYGVIIDEAKGEDDHIHFLLNFKPTTDITKYIGVCKSMSSRLVKEEFELSVRSRKGSLWSPSYCLLTTGGAPIDIIKKYIENQGRKKAG